MHFYVRAAAVAFFFCLLLRLFLFVSVQFSSIRVRVVFMEMIMSAQIHSSGSQHQTAAMLFAQRYILHDCFSHSERDARACVCE